MEKAELTEKSKEEIYIIRGKLSENEKEITENYQKMKERYDVDIALLKNEMRSM